MRSSRSHDEKGLVGVILTIVIVWALIAVIMLTRTLTAAQQIDTTVKSIHTSVVGANSHLQTGCDQNNLAACPSSELPVLTQTEHLADQINTAAVPLTGEAAQIVTAVGSINNTVSGSNGILAEAQDINGVVHQINASATSINSSVVTISSSLSGVNSDVGVIRSTLAAINGQAVTIDTTVVAIKGDTTNIATLATGILAQAKDICADKPVLGLALGPTGPICSGG